MHYLLFTTPTIQKTEPNKLGNTIIQTLLGKPKFAFKFSDSEGKYFTYERIGQIISEASQVPVYCLLEFNIGKGVVGGKVISGYFQGKAMSEIGLRILQGGAADNIPVLQQGTCSGSHTKSTGLAHIRKIGLKLSENKFISRLTLNANGLTLSDNGLAHIKVDSLYLPIRL